MRRLIIFAAAIAAALAAAFIAWPADRCECHPFANPPCTKACFR